jgi:hypothetical protein
MRRINYMKLAGKLLDVVCAMVAILALIPVFVFMEYEILQIFIFFQKYDLQLPDLVCTGLTIGSMCLILVLYVGFIIVMQAFIRGLKEYYHQNIKNKIKIKN